MCMAAEYLDWDVRTKASDCIVDWSKCAYVSSDWVMTDYYKEINGRLGIVIDCFQKPILFHQVYRLSNYCCIGVRRKIKKHAESHDPKTFILSASKPLPN